MTTLDRTNKAFQARTRELRLTVGIADLNDADASEDEVIGTLPAGAMVLGVDIDLPTTFSGGGLSALTCSVGPAAAPTLIVNAANVFAAAGGKAATIPDGTAPSYRASVATQLIARFASTGANMSAITAGSCTISVSYATPEG